MKLSKNKNKNKNSDPQRKIPGEARIRTNRVVTSTRARITLRWTAVCSRFFSRSISNHVPLASTTTLMTINSLSMFKRNDDWHTHLEGVIKPGPVSSLVSQRPPEIESR